MDTVDSGTRSRMMAGIRGKDTKPEVTLRKALFRRGYRYRLHGTGLPGKPDIVLGKYGAVIFVHGCFWHGHDCSLFKWPKTNVKFWRDKIEGNRVRDRRNIENCRILGLRTLVVWECAMKGANKLPFDEVINQVDHWLHSDNQAGLIFGADHS